MMFNWFRSMVANFIQYWKRSSPEIYDAYCDWTLQKRNESCLTPGYSEGLACGLALYFQIKFQPRYMEHLAEAYNRNEDIAMLPQILVKCAIRMLAEQLQRGNVDMYKLRVSGFFDANIFITPLEMFLKKHIDYKVLNGKHPVFKWVKSKLENDRIKTFLDDDFITAVESGSESKLEKYIEKFIKDHFPKY